MALPNLKAGYVQLGAAVPAPLRAQVAKFQHKRELGAIQDAVIELLQEALVAHGLWPVADAETPPK